MTTTAAVTAATALLASQTSAPKFDQADEKEISRIIGLLDGAEGNQVTKLQAHLDTYRAQAQIRAYARVAAKVSSWSTTARILGDDDDATWYEELAISRLALAEAVRLVRLGE
jgi:hypothetical protein